jgi:ubiquinone/menaquinone biosynthesis C-methylase UbiE
MTSTYTDYNQTSRNYDRTRWAAGVEIILGCVAHSQNSLAEVTMLDAGCGSGNYAQAVLPHIRRVEAIDASDAMLQAAAAKLASAETAGKIRFQRAPVEQLPFDDETFDAVMINQVLHHMPDDPSTGFPQHRQAISEVARVLRPGGAFVLNTSSQEQLVSGWYNRLIPQRAIDAFCGRFAPVDVLTEMLVSLGFEMHGRFVPLDALVQVDSICNPRGPLDPKWRDGNSLWSVLNENELDEVCGQIRQMARDGELTQFVERHSAPVRAVGQFTFLYATSGRPPAE